MNEFGKTALSWSGGKDSALALYKIIKSESYELAALFTSISEATDRVPIHEVSESLMRAQVQSLGLRYDVIKMPDQPTNDAYHEYMRPIFQLYKNQGVLGIIYADLFLDEIRQFRNNQLKPFDLTGIYPLWGLNTNSVAKEIIDLGFRAIVTCVDTSVLAAECVGQQYDHSFLEKLPDGVDPCGENGEFHTFVYDGPIFRYPINIILGRGFMTYDGRFAHVELIAGKS